LNTTDWAGLIYFAPAVDNVNLVGQPLSLLRQGKFNQVPMIIGHNGYEGNLAAFIYLQARPSVKISDSAYLAIVNKTFEMWGVGDEVLEWYSKIKQDDGNWLAYSNELGDFSFTCGIVLAAEAIAKSSIPLYVYIFNYVPKNWPFVFLNATHGVELAFVWNNSTLIADSLFTEQEQVLSDRMMTSWGSFAHVSQPGIADWKIFAGDANEVAFLWDVNSDGPVDFSRDICSNWIPLFTK